MYVHPSASTHRLASLIDRYQVPLACIVATLFLMALHRSFGFAGNHYDSANYWSMASLEKILTVRSFRGYVFPALLIPLKSLGSLAPDPVQAYRAGMSITYGVLLTTLVPAAFQKAFGGRLSLVRRLVPVVLLALLFPGVVLYTLSDLPAVLLAFAALLCALNGLDPDASRERFLGMLVAAGALIAAAYNTRTIYLFSGVPLGLVALLAVRGLWKGVAYPRWLGLVAFAVGALAVSLPQLAVNKRTHGISSMAVQSVINNHSLFANQMVWGLTLQRYETTLDGEAPAPQVFYLDPAGVDIFEEVSLKGNLFSLRYYFKVVAQHPLDFLALYTRHVINGLDVRDGLVYTMESSPLRNRTAVFNFLVLALAAFVAVSIRQGAGRPAGNGFRPVPSSWPASLVVLLLPVLAIIPGAIETRFFLPLHLLAYCVIAMHFDLSQMGKMLQRHWAAMLLALVLAASFFFAVSLNTMAHLQYTWPEIYRSGPRL